ncbi:MAG: hypothetical protein V8T86_02535 [Victivallis sp.]
MRGGVPRSRKRRRRTPNTMISRYQDRIDRNREAKIAVAKKAVGRIEDGDIIFLDSSTTVYYLAKELQAASFSNLTVITNSLLVIRDFPLFPDRLLPRRALWPLRRAVECVPPRGDARGPRPAEDRQSVPVGARRGAGGLLLTP